MEFKKKMLFDYKAKLDQILAGYKEEYQEIILKELELQRTACVETNNQEIEVNEKQEVQEINERVVNTVECNEPEISVPGTKKVCEIDDSLLFESSFNCLAASVNQSFYTGEGRRKARRRTGKLINKRKYQPAADEDESFKKRRIEELENFLETRLMERKRNDESKDDEAYIKEIEKLKEQLRNTQKREKNEEKAELERIRLENEEISKKIQEELQDLKLFKETMYKEIMKIEEDKKVRLKETEQEYLEKIQKEREAIEAERTMIVEERRKIEDMKSKEIEMLAIERNAELRRIIAEKALLEQKMEEQSIIIEKEKRLLQEEREKMNQTIQGINVKSSMYFKPKEVKIELPIEMLAEARKTVSRPAKERVNELFQLVKKKYIEKINKSQLVSPQKIKEPLQVLAKVRKSLDKERINPHNLYKRSIDAQTTLLDPRKYIPKTSIPFYTSESEFESEEKKFTPAIFTKDPKLNYIVKNQDHDEIRRFFGNKKDIDVETVFNQIENVTNYSPNKLRKQS
ncbi:hypothetical protein GINT2_000497 [Glugoides intestinalis]